MRYIRGERRRGDDYTKDTSVFMLPGYRSGGKSVAVADGEIPCLKYFWFRSMHRRPMVPLVNSRSSCHAEYSFVTFSGLVVPGVAPASNHVAVCCDVATIEPL